MNTSVAIGDRAAPVAERLAILLACIAPLFALTVRGWVAGMLMLGAVASVLALLRPDQTSGRRATGIDWTAVMLFGLIAPLVAAFTTGLLRGDFRWDQLDAPSRFLLAVPLLLVLRRARTDPYPILRVTIPAAVILTLAYVLIYGSPARWPAGRLATELADPLVFGYVSVACGLMCLMMVGADPEGRRPYAICLLVTAAAAAFYLSVRSGSRTGWAALPVVLGYWIFSRLRPFGRIAAYMGVLGPLLLMVVAYSTVGPIQHRVDAGLDDLRRYSWVGETGNETSLGVRITYLRMATELFMQHPLAGIGDTSRMAPSAYVSFPYASGQVVAEAYQSSFHNQIVSNTVRMGLPGLLATTALLVTPLVVAIGGLRSRHDQTRRVAELGFAFAVTMLVSSLSTEIVDLKYMSSFYAVMTAVFVGTVIARRDDGADAGAARVPR